MSKEIKINPDLFKMTKPKTLKKKTLTGTEIKKALLETIQQKSEDPIMNAIHEIETIKEPIDEFAPGEPCVGYGAPAPPAPTVIA